MEKITEEIDYKEVAATEMMLIMNSCDIIISDDDFNLMQAILESTLKGVLT